MRKFSRLLSNCTGEIFIQKGSKTNPLNYRAILLLTLISKIIHEQTSSFFYLTMKFYTTINQDFEKATWHTHVFAW